MKKLLLIVSMCLISFSLQAQDLPAIKYNSLSDPMPTDPKVKIGKLANGLKYYIRENKLPEKRAYLQIVVKAGSIDEDNDQFGLAHFIEHMCFNGTKHFPKNDLIKVIESSGMKFGQDLNANTSFDRTYYLLQISTESEKNFEDGMQILQDWLANVSFDPEELDKERKVILEEWRLGRGAGERIQKQQFPKMLYGSRYADRDVIGDTATILHAPREVFLRYYKDWYRPNLSAVILVGDFDATVAENKIKKYFEPIKNPTPEREKIYYSIPEHKEPQISIASDKEMPYSMIQMLFKRKAQPQGSFKNYRDGFVHNLAATMLSLRYNELTRKAKPPFMYAGGGYQNNMQISDLAAFTLICMPQTGDIMGGFRALLEEAFRASQHGFTATELERAKTTILKSYETSYNERDKSESEGYASEYFRNFMFNEAMPGIAYEYAFAQKEVPGITLEEINQSIKGMLVNNNLFIGLSLPEKDDIEKPTEAEIMRVFNEVANSKLDAYVDNVTTEPLLKRKPKAGRISEVKDVANLGAKEYTLSNGARVITKKTDFKNDEVQMRAFSYGGTSLMSDADFRTGENAAGIIDACGLGKFDQNTLTKMLQDKMCGVSPYIDDINEGVSGSTTPQDMETFFQLLYSYFKSPRTDTDAFAAFISNTRDQLENQDKDPSSIYRDTIMATLSNYHKRGLPFETKHLDQIKLERAMELYKERFADAGDFTFVFVGNFDQNELENYIKTYIASLPGKNSKEKFVDVGIESPKGKYTKIVKKGTDKKSTVMLRFYNDYEFSSENNYALSTLAELTNIRLYEQIREDKGGVYGVGFGLRGSKYPKAKYTGTVSFGCDPDRVDELISATEKVLNDFKTTLATDEEVAKVKELQKKALEKSSKENDYWMNVIYSSYFLNEPASTIEEKLQRIEKLTAKDIQATAKKYLNFTNYGKFILNPEN